MFRANSFAACAVMGVFLTLPVYAQDTPTAIEEVIVTGRHYRVTELESATKTMTSIMDIPQSIQIITQQIIADQRPLTFGDMVRNVSGFSALRNTGETFRALNLRGFNLVDVSINGLRSTYGLDVQPEGVANIERIEVMKGPSAALYGRGGLGGTVNIVTKRPQADPSAVLSFTTGSGGQIQPTGDITGRLNDSGTVRGRLIFDYEKRDTAIEYVDIERWQVAPSLSFDLNDSTTFDIDGDYRRREGLRFVALPRYGTVTGLNDIRIRYDLFTGEPAQGNTESQVTQVSGRVTHQLNDRWSIIGTGRWTRTTYDQPSVQPTTLQADNRTLNRNFRRFDDKQKELSGDIFISGELDTGSVTHKLVAGIDGDDFSYSDDFYIGFVAPISIVNPVYGAPITGTFQADSTTETIGGWGAYVQDQMDLNERLHMMAGLRYDSIDKTRRLNLAGTEQKRNDEAWSPRFGAAYDVSEGIALFASYGEGLVGTNDGAFNRSGIPYRAGGGRQWEGGVKLDLFNSFSVTGAGFHLTRSGVLVRDPADAANSIQTGEQRSKGLELDMTLQATEGLSVMASYAHIIAKVTEDTTIPVGNVLQSVPKDAGRMWAKYAFPATSVGSFATSVGLSYQSSQFHDITNTLLIPSYTVADAGLFWELDNVGVQLNVTNLFDKKYILRGALNNSGVIPGDQRRFVVTAKTRF